MSGTQTPVIDLSAVVNTGQQTNTILTKMLNALNSGIAINPVPATYTVAGLPTMGALGQMAFASNALKPGETTGSGTGMPVFWDQFTGSWFTTLGVVVAQ